MKKIVFLMVVLMATVAITQQTFAGKKKKTNDTAINWVSMQEAEALMAKKPKKVLVDVYTGWCGWCKVMDKKTYEHPEVIKYVNEHFYAVKLDAEQKEDIAFKGRVFSFVPAQRAHAIAIEMMQGRMSYPTTIFMDEGFENTIPVPGYLAPSKMEIILKYIAGNHHKKQSFEEYQKSFVGTWADPK